MWLLIGCSIFSRYHSLCLFVHVFARVSASWGRAAVISGDRVGGQCTFAVEKRQWCEGLPSGLGSAYRSGLSKFWKRLVFVTISKSILYFYCSQRSKCGDCGACWWQGVPHFVQPAARRWIHRHYHPAVWGRHRGPCSDGQVHDR